ncbi:GFA family protein [Sandaracinus amylolyticus]|uniref:Gfa-like protein n=1 Tax=Sandaracinus amylolyticus TaxID=927083 RepID=A0A0F6YIX7_9BACT|nr:GFA family protein [Sandaracinus amylolyticus]AKF06685.1 Gfa-like protein [Sandaracinus amylolyticus]
MSDAGRAHHTGRCLCGAVSYEVRAPLRALSFCHCSICRRQHSHVGAYASAERDAFVVHDPQGALRWYRSSHDVQRGFCGHCGAGLFFERATESEREVTAGSLDAPTGVRVESHIWVGSKGDYYELADDGLARFEGDPE